MRNNRVACLIAFTLASFLAFPKLSNAEVIGDIRTSAKDSFTVQFEGYVGTLWHNGSLPVTFHVVQPGEDIGKIWVDRYLLSYFPAWMNALACDLNPEVCYRTLHLRPASIADSRVTSTLQFGTEPGIWHGLVPGYMLVLPDLSVVRDTTSVTKPWDPKRSYEDLKKSNYTCQSQLIPGITCETLFDYYNPNINLRKQQPETYEDPVYTYTVHIDSECVKLCAIMKPAGAQRLAPSKFKGVDLWWEEPPFELVTISSLSSLENADLKSVRQVEKVDNPPTFELSKPAKVTSKKAKKARDPTLDLRIDDTKGSFGKSGWGEVQKVSPFSTPDPWHSPRQEQVQKLHKLPMDEDAMKALLDKVETQQTVMIVDNAFDPLHCEFDPEKIVVYDCKNKKNDFSPNSQCERRPNASPAVVAEAAVGTATATAPPARGLCGAAGVVVEHPNPKTKGFRDQNHGTHLAGIIAAKWDDKFGTGGLNPMATVVGVEFDLDKAKNDKYGQWLSAKLSKIMVLNNVRIVNLSLGLTISEQTTTTGGTARTNDWLTQLIRSKKTALFVAAAGNELDPADSCTVIPACKVDTFSNIVSVVALDAFGAKVMTDANFNKNFSIGSTGEQVFAPITMNEFSLFSGSSQAAAIVSGAVSLATSIGENYSMVPSEIRDRLIACSNISDIGLFDKMVGGGLDFDCFLNTQSDLFYLKGTTNNFVIGDVVYTQALTFTDINDGRPDDIDLSRVLGFQRIPGASDEFAVFWAEGNKKQAVKRRGVLKGDEIIKVKIGENTTPLEIKVGDIVKYVKNTI